MARKWVFGMAASLGAISAVGIQTAPALAISPVPPTLKATPHSVMVNTNTIITGKDFTPGSSVQLTECSATSWVVPQAPCNTDNGLTVTANKNGTFKTPFKVELCPGGEHGKQPTSEICYVGVPRPSGIDTAGLSPYAKVTVTYP